MSDPIAPDDRDGVVPPSDMVIPGPRDLRAWRALTQLTMKEVADRAGVGQGTVSRAEKRKGSPKTAHIIAMTQVYADEFRERDDND